jgi:hypothetical protein
MGPDDVEVIEQAHDVLLHLRVGFRVMRFVAVAVSAKVKGNHAMILDEIGKHPRLDPIDLNDVRVSVNQDDGFTGALVDVANANPVRGEKLVLCGYHGRQQADEREQNARTNSAHIYLRCAWPNRACNLDGMTSMVRRHKSFDEA